MGKKSDSFFFRQKMRGFDRAEVYAAALLYMEYRIWYNSKFKKSRKEKVSVILELFHEHLEETVDLDGLSREEVNWQIAEAMRRRGWITLECIIDELDLKVGGTGHMPYTHRAVLISEMKKFLVYEKRIPVTEMVREVNKL